jgi:DNA-binding NarL/FixJ family response regulator
MSEPKKIRIICVDDSRDTLSLFPLLLQGGFEMVAQLRQVAELAAAVAQHQPDVVVLDLWMPGEDPPEAMRHIKAAHPRVHFLMLSSDDSTAQVDRALACGATGYTLKDGSVEKLTTAIRKVAAGEKVTPRWGDRNSMRS